MRTLVPIVVCALALVGAGCVAPAADQGDLGSENGYHYDQDLSITTSDGLNEREREAVVGRAMARIEVIRGLEFTNTTSVKVISRNEFRNRSTGGSADTLTQTQLWNEQVWEALHILGENETYPASRSTNRGSSVLGYYSSNTGAIVLVSDSPTPEVNRWTLVHELVHALQDQQLNLGTNADHQDRQLAIQGVIEGDANHVAEQYRIRCEGSWSCLSVPARGNTRSDSFNQGLFLVSYLPYAEGPRFVESIRQRGGWEAVNDLYEAYPESTEQLIHPSRYPDDEPTNVTVHDRSTDEWDRFDNLSRPVSDTVGEGSIYAMFVTTGVIDRSGRDQYDYEHRLSSGWEGDTLVPYRNGSEGYGYVWRLRWETTEDARAFADAYREILDSDDANQRSDGTYVVTDGGFADAFRLSRDGRSVTVVNAPTVSELGAIHASN